MSVPTVQDYQYHEIELPAFPGTRLIVAHLPMSNLIWFPVADTCEALDLDWRGQHKRLHNPENDLERYLADIPFPTSKGTRGKACIEFEGLGSWLSGIETGRTGEKYREQFKQFRRLVRLATNAILMGHHPALSAPARVAPYQFLEDRLSTVEAVTLAPDRSGTATRAAHCPHCGGPIIIHVGSLRVLRGEE